jgi:hypothetical protein
MKFIIFLVLLCRLSSCFGSSSDVRCLKDLKESLGDPNGALSTWNFISNPTEGYICQFNSVDCWNPGENHVLSVRIGSMDLEGSFPRGLQFCGSMTSLDLSNNNLSGALPADINQQLPYITALDLSNNNFSGEIPRSVRNMTYLSSLNLEHNRFTGRIPEKTEAREFSRLSFFSVAYNSLSGPIPTDLQKFPAKYFAGNDGLCGPPLADRECSRKLSGVNDASSIGVAVGFVVGFVVAFYFPHWFVFSESLRPYIFRMCI